MNEVCPKCKLDKAADKFRLCELCRELQGKIKRKRDPEKNRIHQRNYRDRKRGKPPRAYRKRRNVETMD